MSTSTRIALTERLRTARGRMSQRGMSHQLRTQGYEVSPAMIGKYESGSTPPPEYLAAICRICYVSPTWMLTGEGPQAWYEAEEAAERGLVAMGDAVKQIGAGLSRLAREPAPEVVEIDLGPALVIIRAKRKRAEPPL
ncbi:MAG: helix-turn-helix domain-containing protein [Gemmatimonadetes bacterium]|nr:helix-turn-helix domain-containing protein [Gemmatimonadota bacterium]NNK47936.1 helix-turn-helix transcriptional regulator [Gemmatimonadota bacterium]